MCPGGPDDRVQSSDTHQVVWIQMKTSAYVDLYIMLFENLDRTTWLHLPLETKGTPAVTLTKYNLNTS